MTGEKRYIEEDDQEWLPEHVLQLPINPAQLPDFGRWVNWNGYHYGNPVGPDEPRGNVLNMKGAPHFAYDFSAYFNRRIRSVILGLPPMTPVHAIADGFVVDIDGDDRSGYHTSIILAHATTMPNDLRASLTSDYAHVVPVEGLEFGDHVKAGEIFAHLFADPPLETDQDSHARLVHLHFNLFNRQTASRLMPPDPVEIFASADLSSLKGSPQGCPDFSIKQLPHVPILIANYRKLVINGFYVKNDAPFFYEQSEQRRRTVLSELH